MKKLLYILLFLAPLGAAAQSQIDKFFESPTLAHNQQRADIEQFIGIRIDHTNQAWADAEAQRILKDYIELFHLGVKISVNYDMPKMWFKDIYLCIHEDLNVIKDDIKEFDDYQTATVSVVRKDNTYIVLIFSF
jgi:hypothetical protein